MKTTTLLIRQAFLCLFHRAPHCFQRCILGIPKMKPTSLVESMLPLAFCKVLLAVSHPFSSAVEFYPSKAFLGASAASIDVASTSQATPSLLLLNFLWWLHFWSLLTLFFLAFSLAFFPLSISEEAHGLLTHFLF